MARKQIIDLELHNGVYEPATLPAVKSPEINTPIKQKKVLIGAIDNNFIKTSISINKEMIAPIVFGVAAASLIVGMFEKLKRLE